MTKIKVSEASGAALDWMVAKCDFDAPTVEGGVVHAAQDYMPFQPSADWAQGGPIIEKLRGESCYSFLIENDGEDVYILAWPSAHVFFKGHGETLLIAAMRCYVASKLGDTVEVPEELV